MQTVLFAVNAILPIVLMICLGFVLQRKGFLDDAFLAKGNKLTFRVLLPVLLFYNVYNIADFKSVNWGFILWGVGVILTVFFLAILFVLLFVKEKRQRGVLVQVMFRSNFALIGIPLATMLFGAEGAAAASLLSAFTIPLFNILAVIALTVFGDGENRVNWKKVCLDIAKNPLIWGVLLGLLVLGVRSIFETLGVTFRLKDLEFLYKAIQYVANMATPFALIILGAKFKMEAVSRLWKPILVGTVGRTVVVPLLGIGLAYFLFPQFTGEHFAAYIAAFGSPAAVSSAIMAKEMGGDDELAGQLVVWTTLVSGFTVFLQVVILRHLGIF